MTDAKIPHPDIRERLSELNTKGYYLLVALSFVYRSESATWLLKLAIALTAIAVVSPVQDLTDSEFWLKRMRDGKSVLLAGALLFALIWMWSSTVPASLSSCLQH